MRRVIVLPLLLASCTADPGPDLCEQAARHREDCFGDYITPPVCDEAMTANAERVLGLDCDQLAQLEEADKADGVFCDWFGTGCTPDEPIFTGASCKRGVDCDSGFCLEGHCFDGVASDEMQGILDDWTGTWEDEGSATHLLVDNVETRALRRQLIESATSSLHFSAFIIEEDETGEEMGELFAAAARRGVEVRVTVDATTQNQFSSYDVFNRMRDAGVEIIPFNAATEWASLRWDVPGLTVNMRMHEKMLIVDGKYAVMGGRNVGVDYLTAGKWRDTDVLVSGPGVAGIQRMFLELWDRNSAWELEDDCPNAADYGLYCPDGVSRADDPVYYPYLAAEGPARTRAIWSGPYVQEMPLDYLTYLSLVRAARTSIVIANSYFVPPRRLRKYLKEAAARGVEVTVLTNSLGSTDAWWMYYASLNYYEELIRAGIEIHQYRGAETMHAKTMLIDDAVAVVGSFNLDARSATSNSESIVVLREAEAVGELRRAMDADLAFSDIADYTKLTWSDLLKAKSFLIAEPLL